MVQARSPLRAAALLAALLIPAELFGQTPAWVRPPAKKGYDYPDCYCTNRGQRIEMGGLVCLEVDGRSYLARCEMSLNNPMWRKVQDGCPSTRAAPSLERPGQNVEPG